MVRRMLGLPVCHGRPGKCSRPSGRRARWTGVLASSTAAPSSAPGPVRSSTPEAPKTIAPYSRHVSDPSPPGRNTGKPPRRGSAARHPRGRTRLRSALVEERGGVHAARSFDKMGLWSQPGRTSEPAADRRPHVVAATAATAAAHARTAPASLARTGRARVALGPIRIAGRTARVRSAPTGQARVARAPTRRARAARAPTRPVRVVRPTAPSRVARTERARVARTGRARVARTGRARVARVATRRARAARVPTRPVKVAVRTAPAKVARTGPVRAVTRTGAARAAAGTEPVRVARGPTGRDRVARRGGRTGPTGVRREARARGEVLSGLP